MLTKCSNKSRASAEGSQPEKSGASFLNLPGELRNTIYTLYLKDIQSLIAGSWFSILDRDFLITPSHLNLFLASRQVNVELGSLFWNRFQHLPRCYFKKTKSARSIAMAWQRHGDKRFLSEAGLQYSDDRSIHLRQNLYNSQPYPDGWNGHPGRLVIDALEGSGASYDLHGTQAFCFDEHTVRYGFGAMAVLYTMKDGVVFQFQLQNLMAPKEFWVDGPLWALDWIS